MNSQLTDEFLAYFAKLPQEVRARARKAYRLWRDNPSHPGLHFKRIHGQELLYPVRIGLAWRALGLLDNNTMTWFWIGSHSDYDKLLGQM